MKWAFFQSKQVAASPSMPDISEVNLLLPLVEVCFAPSSLILPLKSCCGPGKFDAALKEI